MRNLVVIACAAGALVAAQATEAAIVTRHDRAGRVVTFDVQAPGVKVGWYAAILGNTIHGDEIETARIRIVSHARVSKLCARIDAQSCYEGDEKGGVLIIPAGRSAAAAHRLLHEYAHHIDMARSNFLHTSRPWASFWWAARGMKTLLANGQASLTYSLGWGRAVGEIFAEDYVQVNLRANYYITSLAPPDRTVRAALRRDLRSTNSRTASGYLDLPARATWSRVTAAGEMQPHSARASSISSRKRPSTRWTPSAPPTASP